MKLVDLAYASDLICVKPGQGQYSVLQGGGVGGRSELCPASTTHTDTQMSPQRLLPYHPGTVTLKIQTEYNRANL